MIFLSHLSNAETGVRVSIPSEGLKDSINQNIINGPFEKVIHELPIQAKNLNFSNAPEIVRVYGQHLFGFNFNEHNELDIQIKNAHIKTNAKIENISFDSTNENSLATLELDLDQLKINIDEVWVKELNVTNLKPNKSNLCGKKFKGDEDYFTKKLWAKASNVSVESKKQIQSIKVTAKIFIQNTKDGIKIKLVSLDNNLSQKINSLYKMKIQTIKLAPIFVKVDNECFPVDTSKVKPFLDSKLQDIKESVFEAAQSWIAEDAVIKVNELISKLKIPNSYKYEKDNSAELLKANTYILPSDNTATILDSRYQSLNHIESNQSENELLNMFYKFSYEIGFNQFHSNSKNSLEIDLEETIQLNRKSLKQDNQARFTWNIIPEDLIPKFKPDLLTQDIDVALSPDYFVNKLKWIESIQLIRKKFIPEGIKLNLNDIQWKSKSEEYLKIAIPVVIDLNKMKGIGPKLGKYVEKIFGNTNGILKLPIQLNLRLKHQNTPEKQLNLILAIHRNFKMDEFGRTSNTDEAAQLIQWFVNKKLNELADDIEKADIFVDLNKPVLNSIDLVGFDQFSNLHIFLNTTTLSKMLPKVDGNKQ